MPINNGDRCCHGDALMFIQHDVSSLMGRVNTSSKRIGITNTWILLDSQSTIDVLCDGELLAQIHRTNITLRIRCNEGMKSTNTRGHMLGYGWVWFYKYRVTFDSAMDNCFHVHKNYWKTLQF